MIYFYAFFCCVLACSLPAVVLTESGAMPVTIDSSGSISPEDIGLAPALNTWEGIPYLDYHHLMTNVTSEPKSPTVARMATDFLLMSAHPPMQTGKDAYKKEKQGTVFAERVIRLLALGHVELALELWKKLGSNEIMTNPMLYRAQFFLALYQSRYGDLKKIVENMRKHCPAKAVEADKAFWDKAESLMPFLVDPLEKVQALAKAQRELLRDTDTQHALSDIHKIVLDKSYQHLKFFDPLRVKVVLRHIRVDKAFLERIPKQFYSLVYYDKVWKDLPDEMRVCILEYLARNQVVSPSALLNFYANCDVSSVMPYDSRGYEGLKACLKTESGLARAALYKELRNKRGLVRKSLLSDFCWAMMRAKLFLVVAPELTNYVDKIEPNNAAKAVAPLCLLLIMLGRNGPSCPSDTLQKWVNLCAEQASDLPAIPIYIITKHGATSEEDLVTLFIKWYKAQSKNASLNKMIWTLAKMAPWIAQRVSLPHLATHVGRVPVDGSMDWALASDRKPLVLGTAVRKGISTHSALLAAKKLKVKSTNLLAVECML